MNPAATTSQSRGTGLRALIAPVRGRLVVGCVLSGVGAALGVVPAIVIAEIARRLLSAPADAAAVWSVVAVGLSATVLSGVAALGASQLCHYADASFRYRTRYALVRHLAALPLGWFTGRGSGEVRKAVSDDVKGIHTLVAHTLADAVAAVTAPVVACVYLFWNDWVLALLLLAFIAASLAVVTPRMQRAYQADMDTWERAQDRVAARAVELVDGIEVVKAYGTTSGVFTRFTSAIDNLSGIGSRWMGAINAPNTLLTNLFSAPALLLWIAVTGTGLISLGWSDVPALVAFLAVGAGLPAGFMNMVQLGYATREAQNSAAHLRGILHTRSLPPGPVTDPPASGTVAFENVSFAYDDGTPALDDVSAVFGEGTLTALVGPSGAGKTTLARLIPRFWDVTGGSIRLGDVDIRELSTQVLLGRIAFVFQETVLLRDTVAANLRLGNPTATDEDLVRAAADARVHDRILTLPDGYDTVLGENGAGLSGGERQRLAIARAMLQDARVVVLDEATAHADPESEAEIQRALARLASGKTVIVIAHRLHTIRHADQILVIDRGRIIERGTHADLLNEYGLYARLWARQSTAPEGAAAGAAGASGRGDLP